MTSEEKLRILLAVSYSGNSLYKDDGELQDNTCMPFIDFKRDSAELIEQKMVERGKSLFNESN